MEIVLENGSVVDADTDAVICSANNWLFLGTGNAGEIREAGGPAIQKECNELIAKNGGKPLPIGSAVVTNSGLLQAPGSIRRAIIHAIGLGYHRYDGKDVYDRILATPEGVAEAVTNVVRIAAEQGFKSFAINLMCARPGYSVLPDAEAPKLMLNVIKKALTKASTNTDIQRVIIRTNLLGSI
jgi:O-acetyl-ADP-ribose deacetylase (regulator of RNase III)